MFVLKNTQARPVGGVSFGLEGRTLVAGGSGGYDVWDLAASTRLFVPSHVEKYLFGCVCDPLGRWLYVSDSRGKFRLLSLDGKAAPPPPGSPHERHVRSFDLAPDGTRLLMSRGGGGSNRIECWDVRAPDSFVAVWALRNGERVAPDEPYLLDESTWSIHGVAIAHDGTTVVTAEEWQSGARGFEPRVMLRDGGTGRTIAELGRSETDFKARLAFSPDAQVVYTWDERVLERWDVKAGRRTGRLPAPGRAHFRDLAVHPSGRLLVTVSGDGQARYWHPADLSPVRALKWGVGKLHAVAVSPDGTLAAAGGEKGQVVVWDVEV